MFDFRTWIYERLSASSLITNLVGTRIYSALDKTPEDKPFIVIRAGSTNPDAVVAGLQDFVIWIHDEPTSYLNIDELMKNVRSVLVGQVSAVDAIAATWLGDSSDLADDARGTFVRNSTYRMAGRR